MKSFNSINIITYKVLKFDKYCCKIVVLFLVAFTYTYFLNEFYILYNFFIVSLIII